MEKLFTLIALNCALRNGDAHPKNFGIVYDEVQGEARLAPVYDIVDDPGVPSHRQPGSYPEWRDQMADGERTKEAGRNTERRHSCKNPTNVGADREAIRETAKEVQAYIKEHEEFAETGKRLLEEWESGSAVALRG